MIKNSHHSGYRGNISQHSKNNYNKPTVHITLDGEKLKDFSLNSEGKQGCALTTPFLFGIGVEVLAVSTK